MKDVIIIGKGPAGISAALYTVRGGWSVTVIGKDGGALLKADKIENFYGFSEPVSGDLLVESSIQGALRLGVEILTGEVLDVSFDGTSYSLQTTVGTLSSKVVILAAGVQRGTPKISGLTALEGLGVSYCAVCDAFFFRGKDVAVIGSGEYALNEARHLLQTSPSVTILTNGESLSADVAEVLSHAKKTPDAPENRLKIDTRKIVEILGEDKIKGVSFEDGSSMDFSGLFIAIGTAGSTDIARKLGIMTDKGKILTNEDMSTMSPGFYAAGDCTGGMLQVAKAVYEGALAGTSAGKYLRTLK